MESIKQCLGLQDPFNPLDTKKNCREQDPTVRDWLNEVFPSCKQLLYCSVRLFPCLKWIPHYNLQWFTGDLIAGVTIGTLVVPQSMGYAKIAGLPVQYGLYSSLLGGVIYCLFGTSKDMAVGPVAVMSILIGNIIPDIQQINNSIPAPQIAMSIAIICGGIITFLGLARLGFMMDFFPLPSIAAFITGAAITICSGQVKTLLGETANFNTNAPVYQIIINTLKRIPSSNGYDAAMGLSPLFVLYALRFACNYGARANPRRARLFFFISALRSSFVILLFTIISVIVNFHRKDDPAFAVVGDIPQGLDACGIPTVDRDVIKALVHDIPACVIALILEHVATAKSLGRINNYSIDTSQELIAIGMTNLLAPFVGGYSGTGSLSRSVIQAKSGVQTPLAGIITAAVVLIALYGMTGVLFFIPKSSLSAVIIHAVGDLIVSPNTIYQFWLISPPDAIIFAFGLLFAIMNTITNSIYITACISLGVLLFRHAKAPGSFLGQTRMGDMRSLRPIFVEVDDTHGEVKLENPRPGVFIYRFSEGFNYPNAGHYFDIFVRTVLKSTRPTNARTCLKKGERQWNEYSHGSEAVDESGSHLPLLRAIILDFSAVNHVDATSIQTLVDVRSQLNRYAAPFQVQWRFVNIRNNWTKRALAAVGFGYPTYSTEIPMVDGESAEPLTPVVTNAPVDEEKGKTPVNCRKSDSCNKPWERSFCSDTSRESQIMSSTRPYFHVDLTSALESLDAYFTINPPT